jgi:hypothetical protein
MLYSPPNRESDLSRTSPRYHFVIRWPDHDHVDPEGTRFPDVGAARRYAQRVIRELKEGGGYGDADLLMVVTDGEGNEVFTIPFRSADS